MAFLPTFCVTAALLLAERGRGGGSSRDHLRNLQAWGVQIAVAATLLALIPSWHGRALVDVARLPFWLGFAAFLLVRDLAEYLYHRAQHAIPALWVMHALHHSDPDMAVLTTQRHFWGDQLIKQCTVWSASLMIVAPTPAIIAAYGMVSLWNLFSHCGLPVNFGRWSWLINSPAYHRRHHSRLPKHHNSNFAALLPIFDVVCGSYHVPEDMPPTGLERRPESFAEVVAWPLVWVRGERASRRSPTPNPLA